MAVYKATYCYPNLSAVDIRTAMKGEADEPVKYLKCKVDTSNKDVTGYSVRLLDGDNNVVFESARISPVSELQTLAAHDLYEVSGTNSGMNGTYLQIPFFQNADLGKGDGNVLSAMLLHSFSAVYYKPRVSCDYVVLGGEADEGADNIGNWKVDADDNLLYPFSADGAVMLNGEPLKIGDAVLVAALGDVDKRGLWEVSSVSADGVLMTPIDGLINETDNKLGAGVYAAILKGDHGSEVFSGAESGDYASHKETELSWWQQYDKNGSLIDIPGLKGVSGDTVKWEITLYQGEGESGEVPLWSSPGVSADCVRYIGYDSVDDGAFDMVLASGTILGSTASRIQISDLGETVLPKGQSGTLVLQKRYIDLSNVYTAVHNGTRVYVETYDSTYGHVYPIEGDLGSSVVASSSCAQFFKHSNDPDDILAGDKVDYATDDAVEFEYRAIGGGSNTYTEADWEDSSKVSCTKRLLCLKEVPDGVSSGDDILLMGQKEAKQNGVWRVYEATEGGVKYTCLKRATSYGSWSSYIGKVIYSPRGRTGNFESLAGAGTYSLWNPHETSSGNSPIYFTGELPILLFPQLLKSGNSVGYYYNGTPAQIGSIYLIGSMTVDGVTPAVGDLIICKDYSIYCVNDVQSTLINMSKTESSLSAYDLFYVSGGQGYGHRVWRVPAGKTGDPAADWSLFTAKILKNTSTRTYISPFSGFRKGMRLKLSNGKQATIGGDKTSWIAIDDANTTFYSIDHGALAQGSDGTEDKIVYNPGNAGIINTSWGLISDGSSSGGTPWKYEIRTFFKASDENVIYLYSDPYLIAYKDGEALTDARLDAWFVRFLVNGGDAEFDDADGSGYLVRGAGIGTAIAERSVALRLDYVQREGVSWESCRWVLFDADGNMLQDTGKMYGGDMSVSFYGLANDTKGSVTYYAVAYVDDEKGNSLRYVIKMPIDTAKEPKKLQAPFEASFDCGTDSVVLSYSDTFAVPPVYKVSDSIYQAYDSSSASPLNSLWDGGISYGAISSETGWTDGYASILDEDNASEPLIDSPDGSSTGKENAVQYSTLTSRATADGVCYSHGVAKKSNSVSLSQNAALRLKDVSSDGSGGFYFETEVALDADFSGDILAVDVESADGAGEDDPGIGAGSAKSPSRKGYVTVGVRLPEQFSDHSTNAFNGSRDSVLVFIEKDGGGRNVAKSGQRVLYTLLMHRYYLQYEGAALSMGTEFCRPNFGDGKFLWKRYDKTSGEWYSSRNALIGNLNLVSSGDVETSATQMFQNYSRSGVYLSHWAEDMYHIDAYKSGTGATDPFGYMQDAPLVQIADSKSGYYQDGLLKWPDDDGASYWNEANFPGPATYDYAKKDTPLFWGDVTPSNSSMEYLRAYKRYRNSGLASKVIRVAINVTDIKGLYDGFDSLGDLACADGVTKLGDYGAVTVTLSKKAA